MRLLFLFIDGVGLGGDQPDNPFIFTKTPGLEKVLDGKRLVCASSGHQGEQATLWSLDATLQVDGLPQSATGQASIFTGQNAPAYMGGHLNGFPDQKLRHFLASRGIFRTLRKEGYKVCFANAYRPPFFEFLRRGLPGNRYSCSTLITYYGGLPFFDLNDLRLGKALFMDITNQLLIDMKFDLPLITPEEGAERLAAISEKYDFTLFEYFLTDLAGHLGDRQEASRVISILDRFIGRLTEAVNLQETMIILTSDHGNLEDLKTRQHTMNKVPAILIGSREARSIVVPDLIDLTDLLPTVKKLIALKGN